MAKINFDVNVPIELALRSIHGDEVTSQFGGMQHLFRTTDGDSIYVSDTVGQLLTEQCVAQDIAAGERILICKQEVGVGRGRKAIRWLVSRPDAGPDSDPEPQQAVRRPAGREQAPAPVPARPNGTYPRPLPASQPAAGPQLLPAQQQQAPVALEWSAALLQQTQALVDVYAAALKHSTKYEGAVKPDAVQAMMISAFIGISQRSGSR
jgi:hypothetical protein